MESLTYTRGGLSAATNIPGKTLDIAIRSGELPAIRSGRRLIILRSDAEAWLRLCKERGYITAGELDDEGKQRLAECNRRRRQQAA